jgi:hypothetical protein
MVRGPTAHPKTRRRGPPKDPAAQGPTVRGPTAHPRGGTIVSPTVVEAAKFLLQDSGEGLCLAWAQISPGRAREWLWTRLLCHKSAAMPKHVQSSAALRCVVLPDPYQLVAIQEQLRMDCAAVANAQTLERLGGLRKANADRRVVLIAREALEDDAEIQTTLDGSGPGFLNTLAKRSGLEGALQSKAACGAGCPRSELDEKSFQGSEFPQIMIVHDNNSEWPLAVLERLVKLSLTIWYQCDADSRQHVDVDVMKNLGAALSLFVSRPAYYTLTTLVWLSPNPCARSLRSFPCVAFSRPDL